MNAVMKKRERLAQVKLALAEKYENLARLSNSQPKQSSYLRRAQTYRHQARLLSA